MAKMSKQEIMNDPEYKSLVAKKNAISWFLAIVELVIFYGFIYWVALDKPFLAQKMTEGKAATIGVPNAVGTILVSWVLTGIYIYWANTKYDDMVKKLKDRIGG